MTWEQSELPLFEQTDKDDEMCAQNNNGQPQERNPITYDSRYSLGRHSNIKNHIDMKSKSARPTEIENRMTATRSWGDSI